MTGKLTVSPSVTDEDARFKFRFDGLAGSTITGFEPAESVAVIPAESVAWIKTSYVPEALYVCVAVKKPLTTDTLLVENPDPSFQSMATVMARPGSESVTCPVSEKTCPWVTAAPGAVNIACWKDSAPLSFALAPIKIVGPDGGPPAESSARTSRTSMAGRRADRLAFRGWDSELTETHRCQS